MNKIIAIESEIRNLLLQRSYARVLQGLLQGLV
jgi:hypothetical protein